MVPTDGWSRPLLLRRLLLWAWSCPWPSRLTWPLFAPSPSLCAVRRCAEHWQAREPLLQPPHEEEEEEVTRLFSWAAPTRTHPSDWVFVLVAGVPSCGMRRRGGGRVAPCPLLLRSLHLAGLASIGSQQNQLWGASCPCCYHAETGSSCSARRPRLSRRCASAGNRASSP